MAVAQLWLIVAVACWGVLAFGAVYSWAHGPLLIGCALAGVIGLVRPAAGAPRIPALSLAVGVVVLTVMAQLVPVPSTLIHQISPRQPAFFKLYSESAGFTRIPLILPLDEAEDRTVATGPTTLSIHPDSTWFGLKFLAAYSVFLLGLTRSLRRRNVRTLAASIVILGIAVALIGIVQSAASTRRIYGFWTPLSTSAMPFGPFVNRNHFAGWMLMATPLAFGFLGSNAARIAGRVPHKWRDRVLWMESDTANQLLWIGVSISVMALSLVMTLSRSGIGGLTLAGSVAAMTILRRSKSRRARGLVLSYLAVIAVVVSLWTGIDRIAVRFQGTEQTAQDRADIWRDAVGIIRDFPLTGTGLSTFGTASVVYGTVEARSFAAEAHNDYLQLAAEGGILLGLPILGLIVVFIREVRRRFLEDMQSGDRTTYWLRLGAACGLIAIAAQEIVEFSLQLPGNAVLFLILAAIAVHRPEPTGRSQDSALRHDRFRTTPNQ